MNTFSCSGNVGYHHNGSMDLYLITSNCQTRGIIQHEFLHALGFWHEHTRPDRENYITILWDNIIPGEYVKFNHFLYLHTKTLLIMFYL